MENVWREAKLINDSTIFKSSEKAIGRKTFILPHSIRQVNRPDRIISTSEVRKVIFEGEVIEDYPEDARGHSCLIFGYGEGNRALHVVCSPKDEYLAIITAYIPKSDQWVDDFEKKMKCMYCQSEMEQGTVPFHIDRKRIHVSLDEVPAWVCFQCGESYFEAAEVDSMQALVRVVEEQTHKLARTA